MRNGGWIPISKALVGELPRNRYFTKLEAMFSLTMDYDRGSSVSICGYSKLWGWSEGRVRRFLREVGATIKYSENTSARQNQRGVIVILIAEGCRSDSEVIKIIDSKWLSGQGKGLRSDSEVKTKGSCSATNNPDPKSFITSSFDAFWGAYPRKVGKAEAAKSWEKIKPDSSLQKQILEALEWQKRQPDWQKDNIKFIPHPATWLNGRRWEDEPQRSNAIELGGYIR